MDAAALSEVDNRAVKYDKNPDGSTNYESVALNPGGNATRLGNAAAGNVVAGSTEAVNGSQLYQTNQNVTRLGDSLTTIPGDTSQANTDASGMGIRYVRTNEAGLTQADASAPGQGSTAVGYNATATAESALALGREARATHAGSVALGANVVADGSTLGTAAYNPGTGALAGLMPVGEVGIGSAGNERRITHLAAGGEDADAVNVSQLKSVAQTVSEVDSAAVKYDKNSDGRTNYERVTLNPGGNATRLGNVAAGDVSAGSTEAINGSQLYQTNQNVTQLGDSLTTIGDTSQANTDANGMFDRDPAGGASGIGSSADRSSQPGRRTDTRRRDGADISPIKQGAQDQDNLRRASLFSPVHSCRGH
ncbi:hypothetical protein PQS91_16725 [Stenotrophomonas geniculata]|uniref:hypothetical protein n=1 Tax=Stenotrophomonas geniculata TaxID=86188 RepID=UPI00234EC333|nr:hypothetical protein [Stenotrophomonas geniculata]MDC7801497.1 hypothetical protein [Stenotrophomonas geniculata]